MADLLCIGCGCTDGDGCVSESGIVNAAGEPLTCTWLRRKDEASAGVCSNCPDDVARFDAGDLELSEKAREAVVAHLDSHESTGVMLMNPEDDEDYEDDDDWDDDDDDWDEEDEEDDDDWDDDDETIFAP